MYQFYIYKQFVHILMIVDVYYINTHRPEQTIYNDIMMVFALSSTYLSTEHIIGVWDENVC